MESKEIPSFCKNLIERSNFIYLTTLKGKGEPEIRAMMNLYNREQFPALKSILLFPPYEFYFSTNTSSEKIEQVKGKNKSSIYFVIESE